MTAGTNTDDAFDDMVDWDLAVAMGTKLVRPGPSVTPEEARQAVAELRRHALDAQGHVRQFTQLVAPGDGSSVAVIDRPSWIRANAEGFRTVLAPLMTKLRARREGMPAGGVVSSVGARVTGVETGTLLAFLAGKVLGQYELFAPYGSADAPTGRLLLVAPNIVAAEREMGVEPGDFRLWVCLHEETHRVQFGAVPWLRDHIMGEVASFLDEADVEPAAMFKRVKAGLSAVVDAVRNDGDSSTTGTGSLLDAVQTPAQKEIIHRLTAVMSLLEGHADYVMDGVGPDIIPSVETIRGKFQARRASAGRPEQVVRRLLGVEAKIRQYRDGERFVRTAVDRVGMDGFNQVWASPANLPTREEIADPDRWVARIHTSPNGSGAPEPG
jgi:coenzyme F420 biosynthesis associated uncharacterized protein